MIKSVFTEKPDNYSYFRLVNGMADVFIRQFDHEEIDDEGNKSYVYNVNEFRVDSKLVTEEMISENPQKYISYTPPAQVQVSELQRIEAIEAALLDMINGGLT